MKTLIDFYHLNDIIEDSLAILDPVYGNDAINQVRGIITDYLSITPARIRFDIDNIKVTLDQKNEINNRVNRRSRREPIQYITGSTGFMGYEFYVGEGVLIPRCDTEILVEEAVQKACENLAISNCKYFNFIELCTGSGCISVSFIKKMRELGIIADCVATDISPLALDYASQNAKQHDCESQIHFVLNDIMSSPEILQNAINKIVNTNNSNSNSIYENIKKIDVDAISNTNNNAKAQINTNAQTNTNAYSNTNTNTNTNANIDNDIKNYMKTGFGEDEEIGICDFSSNAHTFQMILANPPYIRTSVIFSLEPEVSMYEPLIALDGGEDGMVFYRRILEYSHFLLAPGGWILLEIGFDQEKELTQFFERSGDFEIIMVKKDYGNNPRVLMAKKNENQCK